MNKETITNQVLEKLARNTFPVKMPPKDKKEQYEQEFEEFYRKHNLSPLNAWKVIPNQIKNLLEEYFNKEDLKLSYNGQQHNIFIRGKITKLLKDSLNSVVFRKFDQENLHVTIQKDGKIEFIYSVPKHLIVK